MMLKKMDKRIPELFCFVPKFLQEVMEVVLVLVTLLEPGTHIPLWKPLCVSKDMDGSLIAAQELVRVQWCDSQATMQGRIT